MNLQEKCDTFVRQLDMLGWRTAMDDCGGLVLCNDNHRWLHKGVINFFIPCVSRGNVVKFTPIFNMTEVSGLCYREVQIVTNEMMNIKRLCDTFNDVGISAKYLEDGSLASAFKKAYSKTGRRVLKY